MFHHFSQMFLAFYAYFDFWWISFLLKSFAQTLQLGHHDVSTLFSNFFLTFSECSPIWWLLNLILSYFYMYSNSGYMIFHHFYCTWCFMNFFLRKNIFFASTSTSCFSLYPWLKIICYISCVLWHLMFYEILEVKNRF